MDRIVTVRAQRIRLNKMIAAIWTLEKSGTLTIDEAILAMSRLRKMAAYYLPKPGRGA